MAEWTATASRFVAFLDIMGFKDRVFRNKHEAVLKTMESFQLALGEIEQQAEKRLQSVSTPFLVAKSPTPFLDYVERGSVVRPVFFSDSVLLVSSDNSKGSAWQILRTVDYVMGWAMKTGVPIKGAVAYGEQTDDFERSLHFGRPLIDAYELQNELLLYAVALHHSSQEHLTAQGFLTGLDGTFLPDYPAPLKAGQVRHYIVGITPDSSANGLRKAAISRFYTTVSGTARTYVDNTAKYLDWLAEKASESLKKT